LIHEPLYLNLLIIKLNIDISIFKKINLI